MKIPVNKIVAVVLMLTLVGGLELVAQSKMKIVRRGPGGDKVREMNAESVFHVAELSAMLVEDGKDILVDHVMDKEMRLKGYEETELKEGDKILMANGKKVATVKELKELYEGTAAGETFKVGVKRKDESLIASFVKADVKSLPKMRMVIGGEDEDFIGVPQIGLLFGKKDKDVVVRTVMPEAEDALKGVDVKEGDVISSFNTWEVKSFGDFQKRFEKVPSGDKIELTATSKEGKKYTISFKKPESEGRTVIRRKKD